MLLQQVINRIILSLNHHPVDDRKLGISVICVDYRSESALAFA